MFSSEKHMRADMDISRYSHLFFDLDNTLTRSKSIIEPEHKTLLRRMQHTVVVISGAHQVQIHKQLDSLRCIRMGQNGNHTLDATGHELWNDALSPHEESEILQHARTIRGLLTDAIVDDADLLDHRGAQISFSILGHSRPVTEKESCDPRQSKRKHLLETSPLHSDSVEVRIAGTTCFDYFAKGKHKGFNVMRLITLNGWDPSTCLYIGDALYPGGNDESVVGVIETLQVRDYRHTFEMLSKHVRMS